MEKNLKREEEEEEVDDEKQRFAGEEWKVKKDHYSHSHDNDTYEEGSSFVLSSRGKAALAPATPYMNSFFQCLQDPIHPVTNPRGYIALCVAESKLECKKLLAERLSRPSVGKEVFLEEDAYNYGDFRGLPKVREGIAQFLQRFFLLKPMTDDDSSSLLIDPNHIVLGSGASSLLGNLFYTLTEVGDAVLIPAPYYNAFENDMKQIAGCVPIPVYMEDCTLGPTAEELELAALQAERQGFSVKILIITNPHNPLGIIYSPNTLRTAVEWARRRNMHTIVDELYALSVHDVSCSLHKVVLLLLNN
jgi:histidinol-phosphate/aromatic aminotransferase/cobyric acid decarboxylase-like protein